MPELPELRLTSFKINEYRKQGVVFRGDPVKSDVSKMDEIKLGVFVLCLLFILGFHFHFSNVLICADPALAEGYTITAVSRGKELLLTLTRAHMDTNATTNTKAKTKGKRGKSKQSE